MMDPQILVIDDDRAIYQIVESALQHIGMDVVFAASADHAFHYLEEHAPHLILMDLRLPDGVHGWDLIAELKEDWHYSQIPIVAFTACAGESIPRALEAGAVDYIMKPFSIVHLQEVITSHIAALT